ncbi:MAG: WG repeat-containing protein [Bacteroidales bacterium]|nr:WG repeat-containing protein [Bacteroidales bacterium]
MKKYLSLMMLMALIACGLSAQTLCEDRDSKLFGYKNSMGTWMIAPRYQRASEFQGRDRQYAVVKYNNLWGCIDVKGEMMVRNVFATAEEAEAAALEWQGAGEPGKWLYPVCNPATGRWGYVNYYGQWKFKPEYDGAGKFVGTEPINFAAVKFNERWGCIDGKGILIINNVFSTQQDAEAAGHQWVSGLHYETWRMPASNPKTGKYGVVNYLGRWVLQATFEDVAYFGTDHHHAYTQAKMDGRWGNIDRNGNTISQFIFHTQADAADALDQMEHGRLIGDWRLPVQHPTSKSWGWVNYEGEWCIQPIYQGATHFVNDTGNYATAKVGRFWAAIDNTGYHISQPVFILSDEAGQAGREWDNREELGRWQWPVKDTVSKQWGFVNYKGLWSIRPTLEGAKQFDGTGNNRFAPAKREGKWGCLDHTGRFVVPYIYNTSADAYEQGRRWAGKNKF